MQHFGCLTEETESANDVLASLEKALSTSTPIDLLMIDNKFGLEKNNNVLSRISHDQRLKDLKVIIFSTLGLRSAANANQEIKFVDILLKPIRLQALQNALLEAFAPEGETGLPDRNAGRPINTRPQRTRIPRHVLLVEDNPINRKVVVNLLDRFGHQTETAENGAEALDILREKNFDLVLMDIQMPEMDGFEATMHIRAHEPVDDHIPIIAMTAHVLAGDIEHCLASGMDAYLPKPIKPNELFDCVERWAQAPGNRKTPTGPLRDVISGAVEEKNNGGSPQPEPDESGSPAPHGSPEAETETGEPEYRSLKWFERKTPDTTLPGTNPLHRRVEIDTPVKTDPPIPEPVPEPAQGQAISAEDEFLSKNLDGKRLTRLGEPQYLENILPRFGNDLPFFLSMFEEFVLQVQNKVLELKKAQVAGDAQAIKTPGPQP